MIWHSVMASSFRIHADCCRIILRTSRFVVFGFIRRRQAVVVAVSEDASTQVNKTLTPAMTQKSPLVRFGPPGLSGAGQP
jgi:hypothetical protein